MKIIFVSSNKDKIKEASRILNKFGIDVKGMRFKFKELAHTRLEDIVIEKARQIGPVLREPFIVDDAGIFFEAYPEFPGAFTKYIFKVLGYEGILKLLKGRSRKAYFKTAVAYGDGSRKILLFKGICRGMISPVARGTFSPFSPFNSLFIPDGKNKSFAEVSIEEQTGISHRAMALQKFAHHFIKS